jgi:hypothetical protein
VSKSAFGQRFELGAVRLPYTITLGVQLFGSEKFSDAMFAAARRKPIAQTNGRPEYGAGSLKIRKVLILALCSYPDSFLIRLRYSR